MSPPKSTTLRLSTELRDEIARLAEQRGSSMVDVVAAAVDELKRQEWWKQVRLEVDELENDYRVDVQVFEAAAGDGVD